MLLPMLWLGCGGPGTITGGGGSTTSTSGGDGGTAGVSATGGTTTGSGGSTPCFVPPACDAPPPDPGSATTWKHFSSSLVVLEGAPRHRGRDLLLTPADGQWILAKFAYGLADDDLNDEDVDVYLLRDCSTSWEKLGTATTSKDSAPNPTVEGVEDTGGRIYFQVPPTQPLGLGRHRVHLVVKGDLSTTELFIEVLPPTTSILVSDIDGTLTPSDAVEWTSLLTSTIPEANENSPEALGLLATRCVRPFYLTARPEWLMQHTRDFLEQRGFPPGSAHTTLSFLGASGDAAAAYKTDELAMVAARGFPIVYAFGNMASDAQAYEDALILPVDHRIFYHYDDIYGGRRIESYTELLPELTALPPFYP